MVLLTPEFSVKHQHGHEPARPNTLLLALEELVRVDWRLYPLGLYQALSVLHCPLITPDRPTATVHVPSAGAHVHVVDAMLDRIRFDLPGPAPLYLYSLRDRYGVDRECAGTYTRIHRWYPPSGHEIRLDETRGQVFCTISR